ncbi:recombinase family protein [Mucilaginibacter paludis]|uniref:Resolvase domain-containing protein n=1 Tax=Mucilaginibacter paludis DSM 18603 TaxID=714943 RepID=H1Y3I3_9SPHI|nr:recombinase family protein [Mucilaginibacter paludis]EHQ29751.1 Resolvase domain-containing protein [Mucilaginibacter paludis DSM 18603]
MKTAYLYVRVSTDEQADKGYSQRDQQERLKRYCEINSIQVIDVVMEDYSAKTFKRPAWTELLTDLKKRKGKVDHVLFTKWDRFSRNAGDAYMMISKLRLLGVEPQAIEQPLDPSIPENKIMMAFYLAAPEVENDRRALNTFYGMRRARKEGRYMGVAPLGYENKITEYGRKYISIVEEEAEHIRWIFQQLVDGHYAAEQVRKQANERGFKCGSAHFWNIIRNPVYCGKIEVPKFKEEEGYLVQGQHEGIISDKLFFDVQDILTSRAKGAYGAKMVSIDKLPLRGLLICPKCGRMLTGSASKGYSAYYNYYHCQHKCKVRFKAEDANEKFEKVLAGFTIRPERAEIFENELLVEYQNANKHGAFSSSRKDLLKQITEVNVRLSVARKKYYMEETDAADYKIYKAECEAEMVGLEKKLGEMSEGVQKIDKVLHEAVENVSKLQIYWKTYDSMGKRRLFNAVFPEKIWYDGSKYRTVRVNEGIEVIYLKNKELGAFENRKSDLEDHFSAQVAGSRIELPTLGL